ncbi:MAG: caspase family protein [Crocinitomicaceae bacterium]|nr:caspase family protein [Crocinitomicaceae bacterium]
MRKEFSLTLLAVLFCLLTAPIDLFAQGEVVIVYRKSNESQTIHNSAEFPAEDINMSNKENQHYIDEVSYNSDGWYVITSKLAYKGQTYKLTEEFPTEWIKANWDKGYQITNVAFGENKWLVVMTLGSGFTSQRLFSESNAGLLADKIKKAWDENFRISSVAFNGKTGVYIMTKGTGLGGQTYKISKDVPTDWINTYYDKKHNVTFVAHDGENWFTVMSSYADVEAEKFRFYNSLDFEKINLEYEAGYWIYKLCFKLLSKEQSDYLKNVRNAIAATDNEVAIYYYTEALKIVPNDALCLNNRAWAKFKLGQCDGAVDDIDRSIEIEENAYSLHTKGSILVCQKRYREAIDYFNRAILILDEPEAEYFFDRAKAKESIGEKAGAKLDFEKAISIEPSNVDYKVHYELFKQKSVVPVITWDLPFKSYTAAPNDVCRIKLCINSPTKMDDMKIYINNSLFESRGITIADECDQGLDQEIKLQAGKNEVFVQFSVNGQLFKSEIRTIDYNPTKKASNYHALLIAVQDYKDLGIKDLSKPIQDAKELKDILLSKYTFDSSSVTLLQNPTKEMIINELIKLQGELGANDNLLIYYSGHGMNKNEVGYWLPSNSIMDNRSTWLSNSEFRDYLNGIKTEHTLVIADACFSGSIFSGEFRDVESFSCEEMSKVKSRRAMTSGANTVVPDESVFLKYMCTILSANEQNCLSAEELYSRIKPSVISNSPNNQIPQFGILPQVGDEGGNFVFRKK